MFFDTKEIIQRHFSSLRIGNPFPLGQSVDEEAREIEEALRISTQEARERKKKKGKAMHQIPQDIGEPSTASVIP